MPLSNLISGKSSDLPADRLIIQQHAGYLSRLIRLHVRTKPVRIAYDPLGQLDIAGNTIRIERQGRRVYPVYITYDVPIAHGLFV